MSWTTQDIPDLHGRTALVTGVTGGLGAVTARELARAGAHVLLTARDPQRLDESARAVAAAVPGARVDTVLLDLADLAGVRGAAKQVLDTAPRLDILVNNAGVMATPYRRTRDGFELQFGTNHLGHFALTGLLLPALGDARVVTVSSLMHRTVRRVTLDEPRREQHRYRRWVAYGESKLANLQFVLELDRRARAAGLGLTSVGAHPGYTHTHLQTSGPQMAGRSLFSRAMAAATPYLGQSPEVGALPNLCAATLPGLKGGSYIGPSRLMEARGLPKPVDMSRAAKDPQAAEALWALSEQATGVTFLS